MIDSPPVRRLLGTALRRYRENMGFDLDDAARVLECDRSKISRIETGQRGVRAKELRELLTEYNVPDGEQGVLTAIAYTARSSSWWRAYGDILTPTFQDYLALEATAAQILTYDTQQIPDLLQTPGYARAIAAADPTQPAPGTQHRLVASKLARQQAVLPRTDLTVLIGEGALRQQVGGTAIMRDQLQQLADAAGNDPQITIQVVPFACGAHAGIGSGPVSFLRFEGAPTVGAVYLPGLTGGVCLVTQPDMASYTRAFEQLRTSALTPAASARLLRETLSAL